MLTSLEVLNLNKNNISGGSLDILCALPKLQELHISSNPVGELPRLLGACSLLEVLSANEYDEAGSSGIHFGMGCLLMGALALAFTDMCDV